MHTLYNEKSPAEDLAMLVPHDTRIVASVEWRDIEEPKGDTTVLVDNVSVVVAVDDLVSVFEPKNREGCRTRKPGL